MAMKEVKAESLCAIFLFFTYFCTFIQTDIHYDKEVVFIKRNFFSFFIFLHGMDI